MATVAIQASDHSVLEWWQKVIIYQVYPRSFQDSNGDGIGDIPGILSRVEHFVDLGIGAVWLSPFYPSPQYDFGYDISDFCNVDPMFGTLDDFDKLVKALHERDIKIIVDFVPGHTSYLHPWFQKSVNKEEPYSDYYVWHDGKVDADGKRLPPNNWLSVFGGPAWSWCEKRQQYYYRPFVHEQPKLNFRNPYVVAEMEQVIRFWMDKGVDGLRVDAVTYLVEAEDKSLDEPRNLNSSCLPDQFQFLKHIYMESQPENRQLVQQWSNVLDEYSQNQAETKLLLLETYEPAELRNKLRGCGGFPFNMDFIRTMGNMELSGETIKKIVDLEYANLPTGAWPTFVVGNHDNNRIASRYNPIYVDAFNILLLTLKGTPTTYYGEEIGMSDIFVSFEDTQDPFGKSMGPDRFQTYSRDPERSPMQWDSSPNAGFTQASKSWLPVHPDFIKNNVKFQKIADGPTHLKLYKALAELRKEPAFQSGSLSYTLVTSDMFSFVREDPKTCIRYLVALNFGQNSFTGDLGMSPVNATSGLVTASTPAVSEDLTSGHRVSLNKVTLLPGDGLVIKLDSLC